MRLITLTIAALLLSAGYALAYDTDSGTAGRPSAVLTEGACLAVWHNAAGDELRRFHRGEHGLSPANAKGIVSNFQQADTDRDGIVSQVEFLQACKLGFVNSGAGGLDRRGS
jgi:pullulanase/glycogen debranching enzyme